MKKKTYDDDLREATDKIRLKLNKIQHLVNFPKPTQRKALSSIYHITREINDIIGSMRIASISREHALMMKADYAKISLFEKAIDAALSSLTEQGK